MKKTASVRLILPALTLSLLLAACGDPPDPSTPVTALTDSGAGSLRQAITDAKAGDTLKFTATGTLTLDSPITTGKNLTIIATGVTLDAAGKGRVLEVPAGVSVTVQGGTLKGGVGQVLSTASLKTQATSPITYGGVGMNAGNLTLDGVTVTGGTANLGGGIYNAPGATLVVKGTTNITGNKATINTDPNYASGAGGGISNAGTLNMESGSVSGNEAAYYGGGIRSVTGSVLSMSGGTVSNNKCTYAGDLSKLDGCAGGGIHVTGSATISGGTVSGNTATLAGGGVALALHSDGSPATLTISGGTFENNTANGGGAVLSIGALKVTGGTFTGNTTPYEGAGIYVRGGTFDLTGGTIESNTAGTSGGGVSLYSPDGKQTLVNIGGNALVRNNVAKDFAGGVALFSSQVNGATLTVNMSGGTIEGNTADRSAALHLGKTAVLNLSGGSVQNNTATIEAGGIGSSGTINMTGGKVSGNNASGTADGQGWGGGVRLYANSTMTFSSGEISGNKASHTGGGVLVGNGAALTMTGGSISGNSTGGAPTSGGGGGLRLFSGSKTTLSGGVIGNNKSDYGGGIKSDELYAPASLPDSELTIAGVTISGNQATVGNGGGVHAGGKVTIQSGSITGNTAAQKGGGVFVRKVATYSQPGGSVTGNTPDNVYNEP